MGVKGVAGELPPLGQQIVAPGQLRSESQQAAGRENDLLLPVKIVVFLRDAEGEVQVAQIVEHRAAAGEPPRQHTALLLQKAGAALLPGVLVAANDHRVLILPQVENAGVLRHSLREIPLQRQIAIRVCAAAGAGEKSPYHAFLQRSTGLRAACTSSGRPMGILWGAVCMDSASSKAL